MCVHSLLYSLAFLWLVVCFTCTWNFSHAIASVSASITLSPSIDTYNVHNTHYNMYIYKHVLRYSAYSHVIGFILCFLVCLPMSVRLLFSIPILVNFEGLVAVYDCLRGAHATTTIPYINKLFWWKKMVRAGTHERDWKSWNDANRMGPGQ